MGTWGDKPRSRWKRRRLVKRTATGISVLLLLFAILVVISLWALSTEGFWRRYLIPRYFGDYWDTALKWNSFNPRTWPPGFTVENLQLIDPETGEPVLQAGLADVHMRFSTRPWYWDVERIDLRGVQADLEIYGGGESNYRRAVDRLFRGLASRRRSSLATWEEIVPRINIRNFNAEGFILRIADQSTTESATVFQWISEGPIQLSMDPMVTGDFAPGRFDEYFRVGSTGRFFVQSGEWRVEALADVNVESTQFIKFPEAALGVDATLRSMESKATLATLRATVPLHRLVVRPRATAIENGQLVLPAADVQLPLAELNLRLFDPLNGIIDGRLNVEAAWHELRHRLESFFAPQSRPMFREWLEASGESLFLVPHDPLEIDLLTNVRTIGFLQYGAVDPAERRQLAFDVDGVLSARNLGYPGFEAVLQILGGQRPATDDDVPVTLDLSGQITGRQAERAGTVWMDLAVQSARPDIEGILFRLSLSDPQGALQPVEFNPFAPGLRGALLDVVGQPAYSLPRYEIWSGLEPTLEIVATRLMALIRVLQISELRPAVFRHTLLARGREQSNAVTATVLGEVANAEETAAEFLIQHGGPGATTTYEGDVRLTGLRTDRVPQQADLELRMALESQDTTVRLHDYLLQVSRDDAETSVVIALKPPAPAARVSQEPLFLDLANGRGHLAVSVQELTPASLAYLRDLDLLGTGYHFDSPFMRGITRGLGIDPSDPASRGSASLVLDLQIARDLVIRSLIRLSGIPVDRFIRFPFASGPERRYFDATFEETFVLNRESGLLVPQQLELDLFPPGHPQPSAILRFEAGDGAAVDYRGLVNFLGQESREFLQGVLREPKTIRGLIAGMFDRLERLRHTLARGTGRFILRVPGAELAHWSGVLAQFGVPVQSGQLDLDLQVELGTPAGSQRPLAAHGNFRLIDLRMIGLENPLPQFAGEFQITRDDSRLQLSRISSPLPLASGGQPAIAEFSGWSNVETLEAEWTLRLRGIDRSVIDMIESVETSGVAAATALLDRLPHTALPSFQGNNGRFDFSVTASTAPRGEQTRLRIEWSGEGYPTAPAHFAPLGFRITGDFLYVKPATLLVQAVHSELLEQGAAAPILVQDSSSPVTLTIGAADLAAPPQRLQLRTVQQLSEIPTRIAREPLPLFESPITGGTLDLSQTITFPGGAIDPGSRMEEVSSRVLGTIAGLRLGADSPALDLGIEGDLIKSPARLLLRDWFLPVLHNGNPKGGILANLAVLGPEDEFRGTIALVQVRDEFLAMLPYELSLWGGRSESFFTFRSIFQGRLRSDSGRVDVAARARNLGLQPLRLPDGQVYEHPPLHLDLGFASVYDEPTSTILLQQFGAVVQEGELVPIGDEVRPLDAATTPILTIVQSAPLAYELETRRLSEANPEGAGLGLQLGPIDLGTYGPFFENTLGLPLRDGTLSGHGWLVTQGGIATRLDDIALSIRLDDALWQRRSGKIIAIEAALRLAGARRQDVVRLDGLDAVVRYPRNRDEEVDHVSASGYFRGVDPGRPQQLVAEIRSNGLNVSRIVQLVDDVRATSLRGSIDRRIRRPIPSISELVPRELSADVSGDLENVDLFGLKFPQIEFDAELDNARLVISQFTSVTEQGEISFAADADFATTATAWSLDLAMEDVEAMPWFNAFGPVGYRGRVQGLVSGSAQVAARGFTSQEVRSSLHGKAELSLREGQLRGDTFRWLAVGGRPFAAKGKLLLRNNRLLFDILMPWDPDRALTVDGILRNPFPTDESPSYLSAVGRQLITTTVGPNWRWEEYKGEYRPYRQTLFGSIWEAEGVLLPNKPPDIRIRTLRY